MMLPENAGMTMHHVSGQSKTWSRHRFNMVLIMASHLALQVAKCSYLLLK